MKKYNDHMRSCPKCGSYTIRGPKYLASTWGFSYEADKLEYECADCKYTEHTFTKDSEAKPNANRGQQAL